MVALQAGGLKLLAGMTLLTGFVVVFLSRVLHRWRFLFPPEVVGLIAFMVGASQASLAVSRFLGINRMDQTPASDHLLIASCTLAVLAGFSGWGEGKLRLFRHVVSVFSVFSICVS